MIHRDEYDKITRVLAARLRECEKAGEEGGVEEKNLIEWFIEQHLNEIESEAEAYQLTKKLSSIIQRLIMQDRVLVLLQDECV